ncbi:MAG: GntR family transcriptional regulator, partial [Lentisphaerae bacterium]
MTEREIAQQFNVSRATANKALAALVAEGILLFRKGVGTFVCHQRLRYDLGELVSFTARAIAAGHTPTTEVILWEPDLDPVELPPWCQQIWEPAEPFHYLERLRKSDGTPVIYEERCLNATLCKANAMPPEKLGTSLYSL